LHLQDEGRSKPTIEKLIEKYKTFTNNIIENNEKILILKYESITNFSVAEENLKINEDIKQLMFSKFNIDLKNNLKIEECSQKKPKDIILTDPEKEEYITQFKNELIVNDGYKDCLVAYRSLLNLANL
jgi:heterodisulfide reductase subunit A-like polyferredoxin